MVERKAAFAVNINKPVCPDSLVNEHPSSLWSPWSHSLDDNDDNLLLALNISIGII